MSKEISFEDVSIPDTVIAGQYFIISIQAESLDAVVLYDSYNDVVVDKNGAMLLPTNGGYKSNYSGTEISKFISEVLK